MLGAETDTHSAAVEKVPIRQLAEPVQRVCNDEHEKGTKTTCKTGKKNQQGGVWVRVHNGIGWFLTQEGYFLACCLGSA
jgi:hypothetical protein